MPRRTGTQTLTTTECINLFAKAESAAQEAPKPRQKPQPSQRLDIFPLTLPYDQPPPLQSAVVNNTRPPLYMLGWRYSINELIEKHIGRGNEALSTFERRYVQPLHAQHPEIPAITSPELQMSYTLDEGMIYFATNMYKRSYTHGQNRAFADAIKEVIQENVEPMWFRQH
ncbi:hypothetical protein BD626DRAFT_512048 [Schizophyllum amplum]|uniref:Uncharacterized protein n=1 Tax=Schizophyllum amplum TaxID=97359 RepID=A0A550C0F1_9AGAR|nr:hypothetical protein BD626DRAFT_512048 [Auriculariopsis ampla]